MRCTCEADAGLAMSGVGAAGGTAGTGIALGDGWLAKAPVEPAWVAVAWL